MTQLLILFGPLLLLSYSCSQSASGPTNKNMNGWITAKWNFYESSGIMCEDDHSNSPTTCVFKYNEKRYLRSESYILDNKGKIDSIYSYAVPLGVNIYDLEAYGRYMMSLDSAGFNKMKTIRIKWDSSRNIVIDNNQIVKPSKLIGDSIIVYNKAEMTIYRIKKSL